MTTRRELLHRQGLAEGRNPITGLAFDAVHADQALPRYVVRGSGLDWNVYEDRTGQPVNGHEHYDYQDEAQDAADKLNKEAT